MEHHVSVTFLTEIVDGATGATDVATLLRKLKVVAARTSAGKLDEWVNFELGGYDTVDRLPSYRGPFHAAVFGHFVGFMSAELRNVPIPSMSLPSDTRDALFTISLTRSIAEIETLAAQESVNLGWSADAVQYYNHGIATGKVLRVVREDMVLVTGSRPVSRQTFIGVLDAVRNRVLDLALELERVAPAAGEPDATAETRGQVASVVNNYHFYGSSNVAISSSNVEQTITVQKGDEESLMRMLATAGVTADELADLRTALAQDREEAGGENPPKPGARVRRWLATNSLAVGVGAAGNLISGAIMAFFGH